MATQIQNTAKPPRQRTSKDGENGKTNFNKSLLSLPGTNDRIDLQSGETKQNHQQKRASRKPESKGTQHNQWQVVALKLLRNSTCSLSLSTWPRNKQKETWLTWWDNWLEHGNHNPLFVRVAIIPLPACNPVVDFQYMGELWEGHLGCILASRERVIY